MTKKKKGPSKQRYYLQSKLRMIPVGQIGPNERNPREITSRKEISDLKESLESIGKILVPLVVYENPDKIPKYIILDGERRWRAATELSQRDKRFGQVPVNIISSPLSKFENLRTMVNIHMRRREWSTAAVAKTLEEIYQVRPSLAKNPVKKIAYETGMSPSAVREAMAFLRMPKDDREKAYHGDLDEYYLILLSRNMRSVQNGFPDLITEKNWNQTAKVFIGKIDQGWVNDARSFNFLGKAARECLERQQPGLFREVFKQLLEKDSMTPSGVWKAVETRFAITTEEDLVKDTQMYLLKLRAYLSRSRGKLGIKITATLRELQTQLKVFSA